MEFYRIWLILVGHKRVLIWLPIIATCAGLGLAYVLPEQYESSALVVVRPEESLKFNTNSADKKELLDFPVSQAAPIDAPSKTYVEVIKSRAVADQIVYALKLDVKEAKQYDSFFARLRDEVKEWVSDTMRSALNYFKYGRDIPASPYALAVEKVQEKLVVTVRKDTYAFEITFTTGDARQAAAIANMAAEVFLDYSSKTYRVESERARKFIEKQLQESQQALEQARAGLSEFRTAGGTFDLTAEYTEQLKILTTLQNLLAANESKLAGMQRMYSHDSPTIIAQEAERASLKEQISNVQQQLAAYPEKEKRMTSLLGIERLAKDSYETLNKRYEEARVKEAALISEIRIVSHAKPSLYPVKPLKYMYAGLSFAVALVVAIGWALLVEPLDPRVRTARDVEDELKVPVLGRIPTMKPSALSVRT